MNHNNYKECPFYMVEQEVNARRQTVISESWSTGKVTCPMKNTPYVSSYVTMASAKRRLKEMSYVGILKGYDGIIAFGDSKVTIIHELENCLEEAEPAKKVYKGKDYLVAMHHDFDYLDNHKILKVTELVKENLDKDMDELIEVLVKKLRNSLQRRKKAEYDFLFGHKIFEDYELLRLHVSYDEISLKREPDGISSIWGGNLIYTPAQITYNPDTMSVEELKLLAKECFETAVKQGDKYLKYNPIGGKLYIEELA